jgi:hypothetical protein
MISGRIITIAYLEAFDFHVVVHHLPLQISYS